MKRKSFVLLTALVTVLGLGVAGGLSVAKKTQVKVVEVKAAVTSGIEIRFSRPSDWGNNTVCIHTWDNDGDPGTTWPGYAMTYLWDNNLGQAVWSWTPTSGQPLYSNIKFNNNNNGMETSTLSAPSTSQHYYYDNGWQSMACDTMKLYLYDYDGSYDSSTPYAHVWRNGASLTFDEFPGTTMSSAALSGNGRVYEITVSNAVNRIIFSKNGSEQTADLTPTGGNYCYVVGDLQGSGTWWDNINYVYAHNFNQNILDFKHTSTSVQTDTGYCKTGSHYTLAKSTYNLIKNESAVMTELNNNFADALPRLAAWATANGETFDSTTGTFSSVRNIPAIMASKETDTTLLIVIISVLAAAGIGGYFFFRRKRHE